MADVLKIVNNGLSIITNRLKGAGTEPNYLGSGTGAVTIEPDGLETIDGQNNIVLTVQYKFKKIINDSQNWFIIGGL